MLYQNKQIQKDRKKKLDKNENWEKNSNQEYETGQLNHEKFNHRSSQHQPKLAPVDSVHETRPLNKNKKQK